MLPFIEVFARRMELLAHLAHPSSVSPQIPVEVIFYSLVPTDMSR